MFLIFDDGSTGSRRVYHNPYGVISAIMFAEVPKHWVPSRTRWLRDGMWRAGSPERSACDRSRMHTPQVDLSIHHSPRGVSDRIAIGFTKLLRWCADTFFAKRYGHRAVVLETVAAVPGMVGATINHLTCLRRMCDDHGWIKTLMDEAENERMHLMTFVEIAKPTLFERLVIIGVQWVFYLFFFGLYLVSSKTAHRLVGYFEEDAVISYTYYLAEIDQGRRPTCGARHRQDILGPSRKRDLARRGAGGARRRSASPRRQSRLRQ